MKVAAVKHTDNPLEWTKMFNDHGIEIIEKDCHDKNSFIELLKNVDGALIYSLPITDREVLEACPKLKVVSRGGVGVDSVDVNAATELGICVCNTPGINTTEVADHAVAMLLSLTRNIREQDSLIKKGTWADNPKELATFRTINRRIAGNTVGIIGFGDIGRAFASRMRGFGPKSIIAYDSYCAQTTADLYGVELVSLDQVLTQSDFISLHAPATEETHHMINSESISKMKDSVILINCARGPLVDSKDLYTALKDGHMAAAGIDVTEIEPISSEDPLLTLDNLIITPHTAGSSPVSRFEGSIKQAENVISILTGGRPHGLTNPEVIKTITINKLNGDKRWEDFKEFKLP
ncbi:MAG: hydroxyacid dehydrogenase [Chloroflexi bacterium]|nr:hydroxyacid dehydrogenase [Chloroflexota bacterium]|tara:strand:- start:846 stop:1895 length:1050 start_codon:yes stop_codon:yes gene_type:complete